MARRNFTLEDVKNYLNELGFDWKDKMIYDANASKYKIATLESFNKNVFICLKNLFNNQECKFIATINNQTFELIQGTNKIIVSDRWIDYLNIKKTTQTI